MLRAVFLDLDGTLGDTLPLCVEAFRRTLQAHGRGRVDDEAVTRYFGASDRGVLSSCLPEAETEELMREYMGHYLALHPVMAPAPFPWVRGMLAGFRTAGLRLALVTGKEPESAAATLSFFGLTSFFERIETGDPRRVVKGERMLALLGDWGLRPREALYVGDAPSDVEASRAAGVPIAAAAWAGTADKDALAAAGPDYLLSDPSQLSGLVLRLRGTP
ncbi:MAG: HAD hydrolase-like protein [Akkermansiaceae bacterium]|nr:HAD hydrolase-like protein [Akkermansia sp.]MCD7798320.1 HAD hydrolase-like protein [Akkermansiaceae bacterium]